MLASLDPCPIQPNFFCLMLPVCSRLVWQDVVTIIGSNRRYEILEVELLRAGVTQTGPFARSMLGLDHPFLNWVKIGESFGVPGVAVDRAEDLARELEKALTHKGPRLIEAIMS